MFNVSDYLQKFVRLGADISFVREAVIKAIQTECGIDGVDFDVKKGVVYIKGHPAIKSAVFMRKAAILGKIAIAAPKARITDIR